MNLGLMISAMTRHNAIVENVRIGTIKQQRHNITIDETFPF